MFRAVLTAFRGWIFAEAFVAVVVGAVQIILALLSQIAAHEAAAIDTVGFKVLYGKFFAPITQIFCLLGCGGQCLRVSLRGFLFRHNGVSGVWCLVRDGDFGGCFC